MADSVFALSPITANASLPSETDYEAIREAFMETSRGRWFLTEFARRNRNADTSLVLEAVARLEANLPGPKPIEPAGNEALVTAIGELLAEARSQAAVLLSVQDSPDEDSAAFKGVRVLRDMAWTLRENGSDARVPDVLERQAAAIEHGLSGVIGDDVRTNLLSIFDRLGEEIGAIGKARPEADRPADAGVHEAEEQTDAAHGHKTQPAAVAAEGHDSPIDDRLLAEELAPAGSMEAPSPINLDVISRADTVLGHIAAAMAESGDRAGMVSRADASVSPASKPVAKPETAADVPAAAQKSAPPISLGAALLESGIVAKREAPRSDPLLPFKRMTQAERVAFCS